MSDQSSMDSVNGGAIAMSSDIMIGAVIILFFVVVFVFILYIYARRYMGAVPLFGSSTRSLVIGTSSLSPPLRHGLDPALLQALPVHRAAGSAEEALECAVCLSEVGEGEEVRLLPKCGHGFHVQCIDMWFHSHSTCPLCRCPVQGPVPVPVPTESEAAEANVPILPPLPTNVLFFGRGSGMGITTSTSTDTSSSSSSRNGMLVIDIPVRRVEEGSLHMTTASPLSGEEEMAKTPPSTRIQRSLRRLLSRGKMAVTAAAVSLSLSSPSPRGGGSAAAGDIEEQGTSTNPAPTKSTH